VGKLILIVMSNFIIKTKFFVLLVLIIFASCAPPQISDVASDVAPGQTPGAFLFSTIYFILLAFFAYYYIVIRPSQVEEDDKKKFIETLKKNQEVCTSSGIIGRFIQKKDNYIVLEIAPKIEIKVLSSEVSKIPDIEPSKDKNNKDSPNDTSKVQSIKDGKNK
jgi:preprotein translocase subunit YajC